MILHDFCSSGGHATPPCAGDVPIVGDRRDVPSPHVVLHAIHDCHVKTQSTGHGPMLQDCSFGKKGQATPPLAAAFVSTWFLFCVPSPHVAVHISQFSHMNWQSSLHFVKLQVPISGEEGHSIPPFAAAIVTEETRSRVLSPHVSMHAVHDDQFTSQSTGHGSKLHALFSGDRGHSEPPLADAVMIVDKR